MGIVFRVRQLHHNCKATTKADKPQNDFQTERLSDRKTFKMSVLEVEADQPTACEDISIYMDGQL